jgi:hypothetical protein
MLSARNTSFNALFMHDDFKNPFKLVHGSAMKAAAWVLRTNATGRIITVEFNASGSVGKALVKVSDNKVGTYVHHGTPAFKLENVRVELKNKKLQGAGKSAWHGTAMVVSTDKWSFSVWSKPYPNAAANPGKNLLNIQIDPLYDADSDPVAPHGLIGQSWDGDGLAANGLVDDYSASEVTTSAMAEGALEGKASDYAMKAQFSTKFTYSRFDSTSAKHRDVTKLKVDKSKRVKTAAGSVGAAADVDADEDADKA